MVIENAGGIGEGSGAGPLREALGGNPIRRPEGAAEPGQPAATQPLADQATLSDQLEVTLRKTNTDFRQVQERIVENRVVTAGLTDMRDAISNLRIALQNLGQEPMNLDMVSQTIKNIDDLSERVRFNNVPLLADFDADTLGLAGIQPNTLAQQSDQILSGAQSRIEERLREVQQEDVVDRREMSRLEVSMENVNAALNVERLDEIRDLESTLQTLRLQASQRGEPVNLAPDRMLELI